MRWQGRRQSGNVVDRRGVGTGGVILGGGGIGTIVLLGIVLLLGGNPMALLNQAQQQQGRQGGGQVDPEEERHKEFVGVVLADTEDVFNRELPRQLNVEYQEPQLVLFTGAVDSACGRATASVGPFYCPGDRMVYLDLDFFDELSGKLGAKGDFAMAYVVAHEVGHHVQNLLGYSDKLDAARGRVSEEEYNRLSVRLELQADYLAGVFAHHADQTKGILESGDIEEAMGAAEAVGDDRLQRRSQGYVVPDAFTHGTSAQRAKWFRAGYTTGDLPAMEELFTIPYDRL